MLNLVQSKNKISAAVSLLPRLGVGGYFVYAAYTKIIAPEGFVAAIRSYEMLSSSVDPFMAYTLPWLELFAGLLLGLGIWVAEARGLVAAMLVMFIGATGVALAQGLEIDCGCTGENSDESGWGVIIRNSVFLGLLTIDWLAMRCSRRVSRSGSDAAMG